MVWGARGPGKPGEPSSAFRRPRAWLRVVVVDSLVEGIKRIGECMRSIYIGRIPHLNSCGDAPSCRTPHDTPDTGRDRERIRRLPTPHQRRKLHGPGRPPDSSLSGAFASAVIIVGECARNDLSPDLVSTSPFSVPLDPLPSLCLHSYSDGVESCS